MRAGEEPIYPRPELVHEYRRAPNGRNIRFASLHELLSEMHAPEDIVSEVKEVEATQARAFHVSAPEPKFYFHFRQTTMKTFNYSTNDGELTIDDFGRIFTLKFSKASDTSIHLVRTDNLRRIARIKNTRPNDVVDPDQHDSSSRVYTIQLGEAFMAENHSGELLVGRIRAIQDDTRGADRDEVLFEYETHGAHRPPGLLVPLP